MLIKRCSENRETSTRLELTLTVVNLKRKDQEPKGGPIRIQKYTYLSNPLICF